MARTVGIGHQDFEMVITKGIFYMKIRQELTYRDLDSTIDNLWSILYTTGYLTKRGTDDGDMTELIIPNKEIRWIFEEQIQEWFETETKKIH